MKKYLITILASFLIVSVAYAFKPATLFVETLDGIKRQAVYTQAEADKLFKQGYELEKGQILGATLTTISGSTNIKDLGTILPANFNALNSGKIEVGTTSVASITTLENLVSVGTITTGVWSGTAIAVGKGGTGTTSPSQYQVVLGNGSNGLTVASSTGTSGQFLTSNGAGAYPNWQSSTVNQAADYTWTGTHTFATSTMASTTITNFNLNGQNANSLTSMGTSSLHWHPKAAGGSSRTVGNLGLQTITHNLGVIPNLIKIKALSLATSTTPNVPGISFGFSTSATSSQNSVYMSKDQSGVSAETNIISWASNNEPRASLWSVTTTTFVLNWIYPMPRPCVFTWEVEF